MNFFIFLVLAAALTVSACQTKTTETKDQAAKTIATPTATATTSVSPTAAAPSASPKVPKNGNYNAKGVVTKINLELVSVELDHEEIPDLMPAMVMEFFVKEKSELEKLKIGDKIDFVLEYKDGQEKIVSLKKAK